jgi:radical SAM superfamily enzyme YgiQ (UPF0313 family)
MSLVLVQPPDPPDRRISREWMGKFGTSSPKAKAHRDMLPPLDIAYAAAVAQARGIEVKIIDAPALGLDYAFTRKLVETSHPDLVVVNVAMPSIREDLQFAGSLSSGGNGTTSAVIGSVLTVMPEVALKYPGIKFVILEPDIEYPISDLTETLNGKGKLDEVNGVATRGPAGVVSRPSKLQNNLNEMPFPAVDLLPIERYYYSLLPKRNFFTALTSRGCPYGCFYCAYPLGYGETWRWRSPENVVEELAILHDKFHVRSMLFRDQVFTLDVKRTEAICRLIVEKGLDIAWRCETRVDRMNKSVAGWMKKAGCIGVHMGVESGDPKLLSRMGKGVVKGVTVEQVKRAFVDAKAAGMETMANFIIGLPGETKESTLMSFDLARQLNATITSFSAATPYPGTDMYDMAKANGWLISEDWEKYTGLTASMRTDLLSIDDINHAMQMSYSAVNPPTRSGLIHSAFTKQGFSSFLGNPRRSIFHSMEILLGLRREKMLKEYMALRKGEASP